MRPSINRYVTARENNVLRVDFSREPDPPAPCFPGASAMRFQAPIGEALERDRAGLATLSCR